VVRNARGKGTRVVRVAADVEHLLLNSEK
jgi:hypothetical protein